MLRYILLFLIFSSPLFLNGQNSVKTHEGVEIGGIKQWIGATSNDDSKPLLLFLHGGPGFSSRSYSKKFIKYLKNDFIVVQWDQRGTGITEAWNSSNDSLTLDLMHQDTQDVVSYLLEKFDKQKLYLVGFSWGGFLGLNFANENPELLHAYISVSGMINGDESEATTLEFIRNKAMVENNEIATDELSRVTIPFGSWEEIYYQRKWTAYYSDENTSNKTYPESLFKDWSSRWLPLFLAASEVNHSTTIIQIKCPVYFFISRNDLVANNQVAENYLNNLEAEAKEIIWFYESTHEIPSQEPKKFSEELINIGNNTNGVNKQ